MSTAFQAGAFESDAFQIDAGGTAAPITPARFRLDDAALWTVKTNVAATATIALAETALARISTAEQVA
jgi:hypothetical protein